MSEGACWTPWWSCTQWSLWVPYNSDSMILVTMNLKIEKIHDRQENMDEIWQTIGSWGSLECAPPSLFLSKQAQALLREAGLLPVPLRGCLTQTQLDGFWDSGTRLPLWGRPSLGLNWRNRFASLLENGPGKKTSGQPCLTGKCRTWPLGRCWCDGSWPRPAVSHWELWLRLAPKALLARRSMISANRLIRS